MEWLNRKTTSFDEAMDTLPDADSSGSDCKKAQKAIDAGNVQNHPYPLCQVLFNIRGVKKPDGRLGNSRGYEDTIGE